MPTKPGPVLPVHHSVRVTSSSVVDILEAHYGLDVSTSFVTAWYRAGLLPASKSGDGKKSGILRGRRHLRRRRSWGHPRGPGRRPQSSPGSGPESATAGRPAHARSPGDPRRGEVRLEVRMLTEQQIAQRPGVGCSGSSTSSWTRIGSGIQGHGQVTLHRRRALHPLGQHPGAPHRRGLCRPPRPGETSSRWASRPPRRGRRHPQDRRRAWLMGNARLLPILQRVGERTDPRPRHDRPAG